MGEIYDFPIRFRPNCLFLLTKIYIFATLFCLSLLTDEERYRLPRLTLRTKKCLLVITQQLKNEVIWKICSGHDNTNLLYTLSQEKPEIGTVRETFIANQLTSTRHTVEYAGYKKGDFRVDGDIVIEVGGQDKGFSQIAGQDNAYVAADDIEFAFMHKSPLWAFGFLY